MWAQRISLPPQPNALIGRADELAIARGQLLAGNVRLLTLVGPGGVGKTRLSIAVAESVQGEAVFGGGVHFVDLAPLSDPALVLAAVARALGAPDEKGGTTVEGLKDFIGEQRLLVVLDNFEHLLAAAADVGRALGLCTGVVVLVTSREALRLRWERTLPLGPLEIPDSTHLPPLDRLASIPAVALFLERASSSAPHFVLTAENAAAVAELCVRLDGLPLAIELVAARAALLGPAAVLERLARRLPLPVTAMQDAPARQQTLHAALQWSCDLLSASEKVLFQRLAPFGDGCTLEAAEAVAGSRDDASEVPDVLAILTSLADKSLLFVSVEPSGQSRFGMLETVRGFAMGLLKASGDEKAVRRRHAAFFAALAEQSAPQVQGLAQSAVAERLDREQDNLRQALRWSLEQGDAVGMEVALRIAGALGWYWFLRGYPSEARGWFETLLRPGSSGGVPPALRAKALNAAGFRANEHGEYGLAAVLHEQALATWRELGDTPGVVASLHGAADAALWQADSQTARGLYEEGLAVALSRGTADDTALFAFHLGQLWWIEGDLAAAQSHAEQALAVAREAGNTTWPPYALFVLASVAHQRGDVPSAGALYRQSLEVARGNGDRLAMRMALPGLAGLAMLEGDPTRALRLAGAAAALEELFGIAAFPPIRVRQEAWLASSHESLDAEARTAAWHEGRDMTLDRVLAYALEPADTRTDVAAVSPRPRVSGGGPLSPREREVLRLVAQGKSNREIAADLIVSENTAKYHVAQLLNKLGAGSRAEAVALAMTRQLLAPAASSDS